MKSINVDRLQVDGILVHTDCGNRCNNFPELQLVEDCSLSRGIQTHHQDTHLLLPPELIEKFRERETHDCGSLKVQGWRESRYVIAWSMILKSIYRHQRMLESGSDFPYLIQRQCGR